MSATKGRTDWNPFYTAVVVVGTAFVLTAGAYWMEALSASGRFDAGRASKRASEQGPFGGDAGTGRSFMDRWGARILIVELIVLGVAAVLAMGLDRWRSRRAAPRGNSESSGPS